MLIYWHKFRYFAKFCLALTSLMTFFNNLLYQKKYLCIPTGDRGNEEQANNPEQNVKTIIWFQDKAQDLRKPERPFGREVLRKSGNAVLETKKRMMVA